MAKKNYKDYAEFLDQVGHGQLEGVEVTHDGYPLSVKEAKFIDLFIATGDISTSLKTSGIKTLRNVTGKDYIMDEITWRLDQLKKETIADADEIMQYLTRVMRGQEKDQFGLDAPLAERTAAARELARRIIDLPIETAAGLAKPAINVNFNWDGLN